MTEKLLDGAEHGDSEQSLRGHRPEDGQYPATDRPLRHAQRSPATSPAALLTARPSSCWRRRTVCLSMFCAGPESCARTMTDNHPALKRGDAFLHNSPYHGCSHPADHTILVPVIDDDGVHRFTVLAKGIRRIAAMRCRRPTWARPRTSTRKARSSFPRSRSRRTTSISMDIVRMCQMRIRVPEQWWGDYLAMLGCGADRRARNPGARPRRRLGQARTPFADMVRLFSEKRMIDAIRQDARRVAATAASTPRSVPRHAAEGVESRSHGRRSIPRRRMIDVDLRDNPDALPAASTSPRPAPARRRWSASSTASTTPSEERRQLPPHQGPKLRENCIARHSPPSDHLLGCDHQPRRPRRQPVQCAMAELGDGLWAWRNAAAVIPPSSAVISGVDPRRRAFVNQLFLGCTAGPGAPSATAGSPSARRQCRHVLHRQRRARRASPADPRRRAPAHARQRRRRPLPRRAQPVC